MTTRALIALGIGQCVNWGVLYYAFAILVVPLERELGVATWVVTGAFSLALLTSAAAAPTVGRWCDRGRGPYVMQAAGFTAAALLVAWLLMPSIPTLYLIWGALGLCMAAVLYEPAFIIVGRAYRDPAGRLRALALITVFGGLASTIFLPATMLLVTTSGWRLAVLCLAAILTFSTLLTGRVVRHLPHGIPPPAPVKPERVADPPRHRPGFASMAGIFALTTFTSAALTTNLIPVLAERQVPAATAAVLGGLMGAMQLPGRLLLMNGSRAGSPTILLTTSLLLHAGGLSLVVFSASTPAIAIGALVFAVGAGLMTIVRPYLIQTVFTIERAGDLNGRIARHQQLARAAGPIVVALLASRFTYSWVLAALALSFVIVTVVVPAVLSGTVTESVKETA